MARWGMPGPPQYEGAPVTNIRNLDSPHWRGWLGVRNRCLVPATSFCEYADTKPRKTPIWFALDEDRPLFAFAGLWTRWHGVRGPKNARVAGEHQLLRRCNTSRRKKPRRRKGRSSHCGYDHTASSQSTSDQTLFGFLTTEANAVIAPIHAKAMPVILTTPDEFDRWLEEDTVDSLALQRPLSDDALRIVAKGEKEDGVVAALL
jgi:putative SOS response-associated peptidase YedK